MPIRAVGACLGDTILAILSRGIRSEPRPPGGRGLSDSLDTIRRLLTPKSLLKKGETREWWPSSLSIRPLEERRARAQSLQVSGWESKNVPPSSRRSIAG